MNKNNVETVKSANDIVAVIGGYVDLLGAGKWFRGRCPFHNEKTPSFYVSPERGRYKCFGCGKGGDVITFIQEIENTTFPEAVTLLADKAGIVLEKYDDPASQHKAKLYDALAQSQAIYAQVLQQMPSVMAYLTARGVTAETIAKFGIGFAPDDWQSVSGKLKSKFPPDILVDSGLCIHGNKGVYDRFRSRLMFPLYDIAGKVVGFSGRLLQFPGRELLTEKPTSGKYVNSPESLVYHKSEILFGLHAAKYAIKSSGRVVIVEGQFDCVLAQQSGTHETVALSGTALTEQHAHQLARFTDTAILALDGDAAGIKALSRSLQPLYATGITVLVAKLPTGLDPADMIRTDPATWTATLADARDYIDIRLELLAEDSGSQKDHEATLRSDIYPLVRSVGNPIHYDKIVQKIAALLGVSSGAVSADITRSSDTGKKVATEAVIPQNENGYSPKAAELLVGIIGVALEEGIPLASELLHMVQAEMSITSATELANMLGIQYDDAVFMVSAQYATASLSTNGKAAASLVIQEYLKHTRDSLARELSKDPTNNQLSVDYNRVVARIDELYNQL